MGERGGLGRIGAAQRGRVGWVKTGVVGYLWFVPIRLVGVSKVAVVFAILVFSVMPLKEMHFGGEKIKKLCLFSEKKFLFLHQLEK